MDSARAAADALADKKGQDIVLLDVGDLITITDVFVIATGTSRPHVQTLAEEVVKRLKDEGRPPVRHEGTAQAEWVLLDFGDIIVHVFQPEFREYYGLERLWGDAPVIEWEEAEADTA